MEEPSWFLMVKPIFPIEPQINPNTKPQNPPGLLTKQQPFNHPQPKPNLENLIEKFVNQQIAINKQNEE